MIQDSVGNLYGTTENGGAANAGTVYKLAPDGTFTLLHSFNYSDGAYPSAGVIQDSAGNLYGTTLYGGASGRGTVYKLAPDETFTLLHSFNSSDGAYPYAGVIQDSAGNLYGTTWQGGAAGGGVVFAIHPDDDSDGYSTADGDCDDHNATVYPGAPELCDGKDNNCNGTVDEGFDVGASCTAGVGDCQGTGTKGCTANGQGTQCNTSKPDGTACNDGHTCTVADTCQAGMCTYGTFLWSDVLQPVNADDSSIFKLGSTIPVKFKLTGACASITNLIAKIYVAKIDNGVEGTVTEATLTVAAGSGNTFRYDPTNAQYIYNLATKSLSQGTWKIRIDFYDGSAIAASETVVVSLKK